MDYILKAKLACLSTDEKPTTIPGYTGDLKYSILYELDTDKKYYYNGDNWFEIGTKAPIVIVERQQLTGETEDSKCYFEPVPNMEGFADFKNDEELTTNNVLEAKIEIPGMPDAMIVELEYTGFNDGYYWWAVVTESGTFTFNISSSGEDRWFVIEAEDLPETLTIHLKLKVKEAGPK